MSKSFDDNALIRIAAFSGIGTFVVTLLWAVWTIYFGVGPIKDSVEAFQERNLLRITAPRSGATVAVDVVVHGLSFATDKRVYLIVTDPLGTSHVQNGQVMVPPGGLWTAQARLGEVGAGAGQIFHIRALATEKSLAEGPLSDVPGDSVFSDPVAVTRSK